MTVALVVGGSSGIGFACAEALASRGWTVAVADLSRPENPPAGLAHFVQVDARDAKAVDAAVADVEDALGPLVAVTYAAGVARLTPLLEIDAKEWDLVLAVNLRGALNVMQAAGRRMYERGRGAFVFISSVDADDPVAGLGHYCAAKAGLESLVRVAALELGPAGIRCNAVAPGVVRTPLMEPILARTEMRRAFLERIPLGRIAEPADVAATVAFLLSDDAAWITGQTLKVDGGMSLREHPRMLDTTLERRRNE